MSLLSHPPPIEMEKRERVSRWGEWWERWGRKRDNGRENKQGEYENMGEGEGGRRWRESEKKGRFGENYDRLD